MYPETLQRLTDDLADSDILFQQNRYSRIPLKKKIAMACAYLGTQTPTIQ